MVFQVFWIKAILEGFRVYVAYAADAVMSLGMAWRSKGRAVEWQVDRGGREPAAAVTVPR